MRKEFGKWLMDIAKYIVTAIIISSLFGDMDSETIYLAGVIAVSFTLGWGLFLISGKKIDLRKAWQSVRTRLRRRNNNT